MTEISEQAASGEVDRQAYEFAEGLVLQAGGLIRDSLAAGNYTSAWKEDNTPVTSIDIAVNKLVIEELHRQYPGDRVYGEEESSDAEGEQSGNTWVLDPIDGTQALEQEDYVAVTICLARLDSEGNPLFGIVYNPEKDRLFSAVRGEAATMNGEQIHVSDKSVIKGSYIYFGSKVHGEGLVTNGKIYDSIEGAGGKIENRRALAYGCMQVARGLAAGAYIGVKTPFEAASVKLIVEGAGGTVTDLYGGDAGRLDGEIRGLVVSNGLVHQELLAALQPAETNN
jgi:myo-inositol-1(or 4)-monophosphatase